MQANHKQAHKPSPHWAWMLPILLVVCGVAMSQMAQYALWFDEVYTHIQSGSGNFSHQNFNLVDVVVATMTVLPSSPPLYTILQNIWGQIAGHTLVSEHMLPLLLGMLNMAVMYRFGKALFGSWGGVLAALFLGTSALYSYYMHETRFYTLYPLLIALMGWCYWVLITRRHIPKYTYSLAFTLAIALALYTHYLAAAFVLGIALYHVLIRFKRIDLGTKITDERWMSIVRSWMNGCLLFTPWAALFFLHLRSESGSDRAEPLLNILWHSLATYTNYLWLIIVPLILWSAWSHRHKPQTRFLWLWLLSAFVITLIVNIFASFLFHPRHIIPIMVILILLVVQALVTLMESKTGQLFTIPVVIAWVGIGLFFSTRLDMMAALPSYQPPLTIDMLNEMQTTVDQCVTEDDYMVFSVDAPDKDFFQMGVLRYYFEDNPNLLEPISANLMTIANFLGTSEATSLDDTITTTATTNTAAILNTFDTIWLFARDDIDNAAERSTFDDTLTQNGFSRCDIDAANVTIWRYSQSNASCETLSQACN